MVIPGVIPGVIPLSFLKTPSDAGSRPVRALEATAKGEIEGQ
jgi:hypothetical protein